MAEQITRKRRSTAADIFAGFCASVVNRLPFGIPASFLGFALINGFTFGVDLLLLTVFHGWWGLPVWLSITLGYAGAFALSFGLNRTLNFRSHAPVGRQTGLYVVVIAVNYGVFLLGVGGGLVELGLQYHVARIVAGACEGAFMYCALRWVVFRDR